MPVYNQYKLTYTHPETNVTTEKIYNSRAEIREVLHISNGLLCKIIDEKYCSPHYPHLDSKYICIERIKPPRVYKNPALKKQQADEMKSKKLQSGLKELEQSLLSTQATSSQ